MDIQTLLIHLAKGKIEEIIRRISGKDIEKLINQIDKQCKIYRDYVSPDSGIPHLSEYYTIRQSLEHELKQRRIIL
jgi:hypothetical protein